MGFEKEEAKNWLLNPSRSQLLLQRNRKRWRPNPWRLQRIPSPSPHLYQSHRKSGSDCRMPMTSVESGSAEHIQAGCLRLLSSCRAEEVCIAHSFFHMLVCLLGLENFIELVWNKNS